MVNISEPHTKIGTAREGKPEAGAGGLETVLETETGVEVDRDSVTEEAIVEAEPSSPETDTGMGLKEEAKQAEETVGSGEVAGCATSSPSVFAPVPLSVSVPVFSPVSVSSPVSCPVSAPISTPVSATAPVSAPVSVPVSATAPASVSVSASVSAPVSAPVSGPVFAPAPVLAPVSVSASAAELC